MKHETYECNLCGDKYNRKDAVNIMMQYYCIKQEFPVGSKYKLVPMISNETCDKHICNNCITTVGQFYQPQK